MMAWAAVSYWRFLPAAALIFLLTGCVTRKLESCMASLIMIGPGLVTLDCRPPDVQEP